MENVVTFQSFEEIMISAFLRLYFTVHGLYFLSGQAPYGSIKAEWMNNNYGRFFFNQGIGPSWFAMSPLRVDCSISGLTS